MNNVSLVGNLVKDPEMREENKKGKKDETVFVTKFSLAINRENSKDDTADYIRIIVFGSRAKAAHKHLKKGDKAGVIGRIQSGKYTDKDNVERYTTDVVAENIEFL